MSEGVWDGKDLFGYWNVHVRKSNLLMGRLKNPTAETITETLETVSEELVLMCNDKKLIVTYHAIDDQLYDVKVLEVKAGKGNHKHKAAAFITTMGRVSVLDQTQEFREDHLDLAEGTWIKVKCSEFTKTGKFKKATFLRLK